MKTPSTPEGLRTFDEHPPATAAALAWSVPGRNPDWHRAAQAEVREAMPLLAAALDRLAAAHSAGRLP